MGCLLHCDRSLKTINLVSQCCIAASIHLPFKKLTGRKMAYGHIYTDLLQKQTASWHFHVNALGLVKSLRCTQNTTNTNGFHTSAWHLFLVPLCLSENAQHWIIDRSTIIFSGSESVNHSILSSSLHPLITQTFHFHMKMPQKCDCRLQKDISLFQYKRSYHRVVGVLTT